MLQSQSALLEVSPVDKDSAGMDWKPKAAAVQTKVEAGRIRAVDMVKVARIRSEQLIPS